MISTTLDDFYLTSEDLEASPSRQAGVSAQLEAELRRYGCDVIAEASLLLGLPQVVACTAQVLLHRFYCKRSLAAFDVKVMAMATLWLGAKLEEVIEIDAPTKLRLRDVLTVTHRVRYEQIKAEVVRGERHMLRAFGFVVHVEHPHRFVLTFGQLLRVEKDVLQEAWNLANDSLRAPLCVRHKAEVVACGVLFIAARRKGVAMPEAPPWWEVFGVTQAHLTDVCTALMELYRLPRPRYTLLGRDLTAGAQDGGPSPQRAAAVVPAAPSVTAAAVVPAAVDSSAAGAAAVVAAAAGEPAAAAPPPPLPPPPNGTVGSTRTAERPEGDERREGRLSGSRRGRRSSRSRERSSQRRRSRSRSRGRYDRPDRDRGRSRRQRDSSRDRDRDRDRERDRDRGRDRDSGRRR